MEDGFIRVFLVAVYKGLNNISISRDKERKSAFDKHVYNHGIWPSKAFAAHDLNHVFPMQRSLNDV